MVQHSLGRFPRSVGEVHYHSQSIHLLHHRLKNTFKNHLSSHLKNQRKELNLARSIKQSHKDENQLPSKFYMLLLRVPTEQETHLM